MGIPRPVTRLVALLLGLALGLPSRGALPAERPSAGALGRFPIGFERNSGQSDPRIAYSLRGTDATVHFTSTGVTFALVAPPASAATPVAASDAIRRWILRLDFVGARAVAPVGEERAPATVSYFRGSRDRWVTGVESFRRIVYRDLWPGIDLVYFTNGNDLKYELLVAPGADPSVIRLAYHGAEKVTLASSGGLEVRTAIGTLGDVPPESFQGEGVSRRSVRTAFRLVRGGDGVFIYGFDVGAYDRTRPLLIDPNIIYAGYIGGAGPNTKSDHAYGIAVDATGAAYVTGKTSSFDGSFPATVGPDTSFNGQDDAFVAKVAPDGSGLVYAGFIGGSSFESGFGIAVDADGAAYVAGDTGSDETTFPVTVGPGLTFAGSGDCFVAKVSPDGTSLVYAGYISGSGLDACTGIAVDGTGAAYVTGRAVGSYTFPVTVGPDLTYNAGQMDAFVAKVAPDGASLVYAGFIGGDSNDEGNAIAIDADGAAYVVGDTSSTEATFPVTVGPDLTENGLGDVFVAKVAPDGATLEYAGYIGGSINERGWAIAVDAAGAAYITGQTLSVDDFPKLIGPNSMSNGNTDAFVAKVAPGGATLAYSGWLGGSNYDEGFGIAVDGDGAAFVTGRTSSNQATFPTYGAFDALANGGQDAFVLKIVPSGSGVSWSSFLGGSGTDIGYAIALGPDGSLYVAGETNSTEATFPETGGPDLTFNGGSSDAFVAKIGDINPPSTTTSTSSSTTTTKSSTITSTTKKATTTTTKNSTTSTTNAGGGISTTSSSTTSTTAPPPPPEHLLCYRTTMRRTVAVDLADQFDAAHYQGTAATVLCTRAQVGDAAPADADAYMVGYRIKGRHAHRADVGAINYLVRFALRYDTKRTDRLLTPSEGGPPAAPGSASTTDAYRCVKVKLNRRGPAFTPGTSVQLADRFGSRVLLLKRPTSLCVPTAVNGGPIADPATQLVCYKSRVALPRGAAGVDVSDRFGRASFDLVRESEVCIPSTLAP